MKFIVHGTGIFQNTFFEICQKLKKKKNAVSHIFQIESIPFDKIQRLILWHVG